MEFGIWPMNSETCSAVVGRLCDEIIVLERGRVVEHGETRAILSRPESPFTRRLLDSVPSLSPAS